MSKYVAYYRVSTDKQGKSGLGLDAQRAAVAAYLATVPCPPDGTRRLANPEHPSPCPPKESLSLAGEFTEVESGKVNDRPRLGEAMALCRLTGARLLIAKLDRLSRDAHFLLGLEKAGIDFVAADMPHANRLTIGIMAMVADEERRMISARTKAALAAAKARGKVLGGYRGGKVPDGRKGGARRREKAEEFAGRLRDVLGGMEGLSLRAKARALTEAGVMTPQGGLWTSTGVRRVLARLNCGH